MKAVVVGVHTIRSIREDGNQGFGALMTASSNESARYMGNSKYQQCYRCLNACKCDVGAHMRAPIEMSAKDMGNINDYQ